MLTPVEKKAKESGYVRCPNRHTRWYPGGPGIPTFEYWYQEIHIENEVVNAYEYQHGRGLVLKYTYKSWDDYIANVSEHGKLSEPGLPPFSNSWD